jgi:hypothetical protein
MLLLNLNFTALIQMGGKEIYRSQQCRYSQQESEQWKNRDTAQQETRCDKKEKQSDSRF